MTPYYTKPYPERLKPLAPKKQKIFNIFDKSPLQLSTPRDSFHNTSTYRINKPHRFDILTHKGEVREFHLIDVKINSQTKLYCPHCGKELKTTILTDNWQIAKLYQIQRKKSYDLLCEDNCKRSPSIPKGTKTRFLPARFLLITTTWTKEGK